jgi:Ca2+-binding EF-hand superfamily protein
MSVSSVGSLQSQQQWLTFQSVDSDNDDALSLQEFSAAGQNMPGGIGSLDSSSVQSLFSAIDSDGNGQISRSEATSAFQKLSSALQGTLLGTQEQTGSPSPAGMFASADTDGSGGLSFDEFKADVTKHLPAGATAPTDDQLQTIFGKLDKDGDGQISQSEMKAAHHGHHHHAAPPPDDTSSTDSVFGPDPFSTAASSTDPSATGSGTDSTSLPTDLNSLLLQAMSAYNGNPNQSTSSNLVDQLVDVLKGVA